MSALTLAGSIAALSYWPATTGTADGDRSAEHLQPLTRNSGLSRPPRRRSAMRRSAYFTLALELARSGSPSTESSLTCWATRLACRLSSG
jgi:hypothetical protein